MGTEAKTMTYTLLNLLFLGIAAVFFMAVVRPARWPLFGFTLIPMLLLTAIFDNAIIAADIVAYDPTKVSGVTVGLAPIEDFAYTVAAVLLVPSIWWLLNRKRGSR